MIAAIKLTMRNQYWFALFGGAGRSLPVHSRSKTTDPYQQIFACRGKVCIDGILRKISSVR